MGDIVDANVEARKVIGWWLVVLLACITVAMLGCLPPRSSPPLDRTLVVSAGNWPYSALAMTTCSSTNKPVIILRDVQIDTNIAKIIMVHELVHVRQLQRDCIGTYQRYLTDSAFRLSMELEAYCEDSAYALSIGASPAWVAERLSGLMRDMYGVEEATCDWKRRLS